MGAEVFGRLVPEDIGAAHVSHNHDGLASTSYIHEQSPASSVWTINHNLGFQPGGIRIFDSAGTEFYPGNIEYKPGNNTVVITWSSAFSGMAYIS